MTKETYEVTAYAFSGLASFSFIILPFIWEWIIYHCALFKRPAHFVKLKIFLAFFALSNLLPGHEVLCSI